MSRDLRRLISKFLRLDSGLLLMVNAVLTPLVHTHNIHTRRSMLLGGLEMSPEGEEPKGCCGAGSVVCVRVCGLTSIPYTACVEMQL